MTFKLIKLNYINICNDISTKWNFNRGMIGVTEPRIVATISMAERVGKEMTKFERDMTKTLEEHKEAIKKSLRKVSYQYR